MSDEPTTLQHMKYWRYAIWKWASGNFITGAGIATTLVMTWQKMSSAEQLVAVIAAGITLIKWNDGFFDQAIARLASGKTIIPIPNGNGNGHDVPVQITETTITPK